MDKARTYRIIAGKLCCINDGIAANVGRHTLPETSKSLFPALLLHLRVMSRQPAVHVYHGLQAITEQFPHNQKWSVFRN